MFADALIHRKHIRCSFSTDQRCYRYLLFTKLSILFIDPTVPIVVGVLIFCLLLILILTGVTILIIFCILKKKGKDILFL